MLSLSDSSRSRTASRVIGPEQERGTFANLAWVSDMDQHQHMRQLLMRTGGDVTSYNIPLAHPAATAMLLNNGNEWAFSLTRATAGDLKQAAPRIAALLPAGSIVTAPEPLGERVSQAWAQLSGQNTRQLHEDAYYVMHKPRLLRPLQQMPFVLASALGKAQAAEEMAFCWLDVHHRSVPAREFEQLLQFTDAVLWRPQQPTQSFHLFTELAPKTEINPRHILLGGACGQSAQLPYLFAHLAQQPGKVSALAAHDRHSGCAPEGGWFSGMSGAWSSRLIN